MEICDGHRFFGRRIGKIGKTKERNLEATMRKEVSG